MKLLVNLTLLSAVLFLPACIGPFESKTCGIKNSEWQRMSAAEQFDIEKSFHEKQRLAEQLRTNDIMVKQQKNLAKARKNDEIAQERRLDEERVDIKKQQSKIDEDLKHKQQIYTNPPIAVEASNSVENL